MWLMGGGGHKAETVAQTGPVRPGLESELCARASEKPWKVFKERNDMT